MFEKLQERRPRNNPRRDHLAAIVAALFYGNRRLPIQFRHCRENADPVVKMPTLRKSAIHESH